MLQQRGVDIVQCQSQLLVFLILIVVALFQVGLLFLGDNFLHQLHGRVVLTAVTGTFLLNRNLLQCLGVLAQRNKQLICFICNVYGLALIAHNADYQLATLDATNGEAALQVGDGSQLPVLVLYGGKTDTLTSSLVDHMALYQMLRHRR